MANFTITTRLKKRNGEYLIPSNGLVAVYIAVSHNGATRHINTGLKTSFSSMRKTYNRLDNVTYEVGDFFVIKKCMELIEQYMERSNRYNIDKMSCNELVELLKRDEDSIPFFNYANKFISEMINDGSAGAKNYKTALKNFSEFVDYENLTFRDIDSRLINSWIRSLKHTSRAKQMYPSAIKTIFKAGADLYNDYDNGVILISNDPFRRVSIPKASIPEKRSVDRKSVV